MEKARIIVYKNREKESLEVMFNPKEYENNIKVNWTGNGEDSAAKGQTSPFIGNPNFLGSNFESFSINLFFDSYEEQTDVREDHKTSRFGVVKTIIGTKRIAALGMPTVEGRKKKRPPVCLFSWGKFNFKGVIESVKQKFTMFLSDGTPVRADVTITMRSIYTEQDIVKMMGIEACRKLRVVKEGERLDIIAEEELKDSSLWRKIAEANNIDDPINFPHPEDIGRILVIPD